MSRRLENFRAGDRAEHMGIGLLQAVCAVAPIPRQEDFGLFDALATLLRREAGFLYAESSFLVQFKSRSERTIEYAGDRFTCLVGQEVSVLVGQVDLTAGPRLDLYTLGPGIAHPNLLDCTGLVAHLGQHAAGPEDGVLHVRLDRPVLSFTGGQVEDPEFKELAYRVLHEHLRLERENRRLGGFGQSRMVHWETNEVPTTRGTMLALVHGRDEHHLGQLTPALRLFAVLAVQERELREPVRQLASWMRRNGVDPDPGGMHVWLLNHQQVQERLEEVLSEADDADFAITFEVVQAGVDFLNFWVHRASRDGPSGGASRHHGSLADLEAEGFEVGVAIEGKNAEITIGLSDEYIKARGLVELRVVTDASTPVVRGGVPEVFLFGRSELVPDE